VPPFGAHAVVTLVIALVAALAAGCARPGPPGGGPADSTPPAVVATVPAPGAVQVGPLRRIEIEFSEEMNRDSVERAVAVTPPVLLRGFSWKGRTLIAEPRETLPDSTTFVVRIGDAARDYHDVALASAYTLAFSTGASIDRCVIAGTVTATEGTEVRATVWACPRPAPPDTVRSVDPCGYVTAAGPNGSFRIGNVKAQETPYSIIAFVDEDGDGRYSPRTETGVIEGGVALVRSPGDSVVGIVLPLAAPPTPARAAEEEEDQ
jgi:hypothetical protein